MVAVLVAYDSLAADVAAPFRQFLLRLVAPFVMQSVETLADIIAIHTDPLTWTGRSFFYNEPTMIVDISWSGNTSPKNSIGLGRVEDDHRHKHTTHQQQISHGRPPSRNCRFLSSSCSMLRLLAIGSEPTQKKIAVRG